MLGFRFRRHRTRTGKIHPAAIVGICLGVAVLVSLLVGNLLNLWLDDETYRKLTDGNTENTPNDPLFEAKVRNINAYPFTLGEDIDPVLGLPAVSVAINSARGEVAYSSAVAAYQGLTQKNEVLLSDTLGELCAFVPYVSGVFYPQAFARDTSDLFYAASVEEAALLREFVHAGGSEILLCGIPLSLQEIDRTVSYLTVLKTASPQTAIGVAVPLSAAKSQDSWEILSKLLTVCDFCALDLTNEAVVDEEPTDSDISPAALSLLSDCSYYLQAYDMRILLSSEQTNLLTTLEIQMYPNYQVIFPAS